MSFDAYEVAIKLKLINELSPAMAAVTRHVQGATKSVDELEKRLAGLKRLGMAGGALAAVGAGALAMLKGPIDEAVKLDQAFSKFKLFGMGDKVNDEAMRFARGMNVIGTSYTENMKLMTEAQGIFRESGIGGMEALDGAKLAAPLLAKIEFSTKSLDGEKAAKFRTSSMAMLRWIEDSGGLKSPQRFKELADAGWKMTQTSGGSVNWEQLRQFSARGGVAAMGLTGNAMAEMEPIITMLKGQTAGFSLRTAYNRLNGIVKIPNQVAHELVNNGVWDAKKVVWNQMGGIKAFKGNPLINSALFNSSPIEAYEKIIMPLHKKLGIITLDQIAQANAMMYGSTGGALFTLVDKNMPKLHQSLAAQNKALGIDDSYTVAERSAQGKFNALHSQWEKTLTNLGNIVLPVVIAGVSRLTLILEKINQFAQRHPTLSKMIALIGVTTASVALLGGTALLATAGIRSLTLAAGGLPASLGVATTALKYLGVAAVAAFAVFDAYKAVTTGNSASYDAVNAVGAGISGNKDFSLGVSIYELMHAGKKSVASEGYWEGHHREGNHWKKDLQTVQSAKENPVEVHVHNKVDGHGLTTMVTREQTKSANRPQGGTSGFDANRAVMHVGGSGSW